VLLILSLALLVMGADAPSLDPDLVVYNANIITMDSRNPRAEALAVKNGRFVAVGTTARIRALAGRATKLIDAHGKTITPGFVDAHMHPEPIYPAASPLAVVDLSPASVKTMEDVIHALREKAKITPKGQWVRGDLYQDTKLGRHPTRWDLDKASTENPIIIGHSSGHVSAVNSLALQMARISRATPDPPGGGFDRDADGEPTGVCREGAGAIVRQAGPPMPVATREQELEGMRLCFRKFRSKGITSIGDAGATPEKLRLYQDLAAADEPMRVYVMLRDRYLPDLKKLRLQTGFGNDRVRTGAIKMFHGNSVSGGTCWLYEPYANRPDYYGIPPARSQAELDQLILDIHEAGFQAAVHSNGDREIEMVLDAFEKALNKLPKANHRHRIEHCSIVNQRILERVKKLGVVLVLHSYIYEHGDKMEAFGVKRWGLMHPNRSALEMGIPVAGHSDYPVAAADPLLRIQSLATRRSAEEKVYGPEQRITVEQAMRNWTLGSAFASFEDDIKGSIESGKLADFVILSADPTRVPLDTIKDTRVEKTVIAGKTVD
jgi:predicted amidohydrolase YtcJ